MKDEKVFGKIGLNLDDDPRYFGVNDTDLIENMLPNVDGDAGLEETYLGIFRYRHRLIMGVVSMLLGPARMSKLITFIYSLRLTTHWLMATLLFSMILSLKLTAR